MVYKLNGEQPFQVLSSDFSISPSESGYELYFSADGFNYTSFATVGAGVTRQFTGMNAGNYYKLMGNTGEVSVNWERDCCGGQGGGGVAGVSSLNGQTGALTTKTINGNDILGSGDITIEGGDGIYYVDGDNINNYSGVVDEIYHKLSSGETAYATVKYDYTKYPVAKAEIYEYQEGQPGNSDYLRREGFQIIAARFGSDGYAIRSGIINVFRYEGRDGNGYSCGQGWDYAMPEASATVKYLTEDTWPGAYWEIGTEVPDGGVWGASIRRPDNTEIFETYNRQGDVVVMGEGNIPNTDSIEGNLQITDENEHIMLDGQGNRYVFRMDFSNGRLYFYHSPEQVGNFVYEGAQGTPHTTGETSGTVHIELAKVLSGDSWVQKDEMLFPKTYYIDNMTTEERVALYNLIRYSGPKVSPISKFCRFFSQITDKDGFMGMCEVYFCRFDTNLSFSGNAMSRNSDALIKVSFNLTSDGNIDRKTVTEYSLSEKVVSLSQSDYDALVQAGTVDANTLYVII